MFFKTIRAFHSQYTRLPWSFASCWDRVPLFAYTVRIASMILRTAKFLCVLYAEICVNATAAGNVEQAASYLDQQISLHSISRWRRLRLHGNRNVAQRARDDGKRDCPALPCWNNCDCLDIGHLFFLNSALVVVIRVCRPLAWLVRHFIDGL